MFVILMVILTLLAYFFYKTIHHYEVILYSSATLLSIGAIVLYDDPALDFINVGFLGLSFLLVVMMTGAFKKGTKLCIRLKSVRKEYSILGFILIIPHGLIYLYYALNQSISYEWFGIISFVVMIPLFITSFKWIRHKMTREAWNKLQKFAYLAYLLLFIHLMLTTSLYAIEYIIIFGLYIFMKQMNYIFHKQAIIKALTFTSLMIVGVIYFSGIPIFSSPIDDTTITIDSESSSLIDGTYRAQAPGYENLTVDLAVTIENGLIMDITFYDCGCTPDDKRGFYLDSANLLISQIISTQSTNIDIISGATHTSEGVLQAVEAALLQATPA